MRKTTSKDLNRVLRELERQGWTIEDSRSGHVRVHHPDGRSFSCSRTPSCQHAHKRLLQDINRYKGKP